MPNSQVAFIGMIISAVLGFVGGIVLYFTFLNKSNENRFRGFWGWVYDFLSFKKMLIENLLRISYLILTVTVTLTSFFAGNFLLTILSLLVGNLIVRLVYEFSLIMLIMCRNTTEINKKLSNSTVVKNEETNV